MLEKKEKMLEKLYTFNRSTEMQQSAFENDINDKESQRVHWLNERKRRYLEFFNS